MCGIKNERCSFGAAEIESLRSLQRGVFVRTDLPPGTKIGPRDVFYAIPSTDGQIVANDMSKYTDFYATEPIRAGEPAMLAALRRCEKREYLHRIIADVRKLLKRSKVSIPGQLELEVSHHYGIESFNEHGSVMITVVNREYCKKIIVLLPG